MSEDKKNLNEQLGEMDEMELAEKAAGGAPESETVDGEAEEQTFAGEKPDAMHMMEAEIGDLRLELEKSKKDLELTQEVVAGLNKQAGDFQTQAVEANQRVKELEGTNAELVVQKDDAERRYAEEVEQTEKLQSEIARLKEQNSTLGELNVAMAERNYPR